MVCAALLHLSCLKCGIQNGCVSLLKLSQLLKSQILEEKEKGNTERKAAHKFAVGYLVRFFFLIPLACILELLQEAS